MALNKANKTFWRGRWVSKFKDDLMFFYLFYLGLGTHFSNLPQDILILKKKIAEVNIE